MMATEFLISNNLTNKKRKQFVSVCLFSVSNLQGPTAVSLQELLNTTLFETALAQQLKVT
jgi:hypothetical protein